MRELVRTNDAVLLSYVTAMLAEAGIEAILLDQHMSVLDGPIGALPRRLMVTDDDFPRACRVLDDVAPEWRSAPTPLG